MPVGKRLGSAVHRNKALSREGLLERVFSFAFRGLVYPQIWEDPDIDMAAMALGPGHRLVCIASGSCNVLSYLTARPEAIIAVDLSPAHVALGRLKLAAARHLDHGAFHALFGHADRNDNIRLYDTVLRARLDPGTRAWWDRRGWDGRRRIAMLSRGFYRFGLLGACIGWGHRLARIHGVDPGQLADCTSLAQQQAFFEDRLAPLFDRPLIRLLFSMRGSLFGLGIPPAQYEALAGGETMVQVLRERTRKLAAGFDLSDNYFAWQAFARRYAPDGPLPPYLRQENFGSVRDGADRVTILNESLTDHLRGLPAASQDRYVLLDAQDWMTDDQLNALWAEITRTAAPGARVIFRTAAEPTLLPGRVSDDLLSFWSYREAESRAYSAADRSAIYGGFHLYELRA
ncbi:MAG: DUF3419 family protein [Rhodobiaceae bacterium]|nr:DUF3419 family protein [Rhodobiaceae bacterium]